MEFSDKKTGKKSVMFDPARANVVPKSVLPESEQEEYESQRLVHLSDTSSSINGSRLWGKLTEAIKAADMHGATAAKSAVEDRQRELARRRGSAGEKAPESRFFVQVEGDRWMPKLRVDK